MTDPEQANSSSSTGESQPQDLAVAQAQTAQLEDSAGQPQSAADWPEADASDAAEEAEQAAEQPEAAADAVAAAPSSSKRSLSFKSVIDQTMRRQGSTVHGDAGDSPRHHIGQGFAKWISRAVGHAGLKVKTDIEDLPAYKLRVRHGLQGMRNALCACTPPPLPPPCCPDPYI